MLDILISQQNLPGTKILTLSKLLAFLESFTQITRVVIVKTGIINVAGNGSRRNGPMVNFSKQEVCFELLHIFFLCCLLCTIVSMVIIPQDLFLFWWNPYWISSVTKIRWFSARKYKESRLQDCFIQIRVLWQWFRSTKNFLKSDLAPCDSKSARWLDSWLLWSVNQNMSKSCIALVW